MKQTLTKKTWSPPIWKAQSFLVIGSIVSSHMILCSFTDMTTWEVMHHKNYPKPMFLNSVMVLIVAEYLYHVILHARKKYSFSFEQNKYLRYRILVSVIIPQLLAFILAALFFLLAKQNIFTETVWFTNYFMVDLAFILLGNGLIELFIWRQFKAYEKAEDALEDTEIPAVPSPVSTIAAQQEQPVKKYNKQKNIKVDPKLAIIYREEDALISLTTQDTLGNWPIGLSINASFTMLPATYFKINQSCIINIDGIADAWYVRETQRLHVQPVFGLPERKVSYAKNRNFKDWLATFGREMRIISKDQA